MAGLVAALSWGAAAAQAAEPMLPVAAASCEAPQRADEEHPLADRKELLSRYESLPASCLKAIFMVCSNASSQTILDMGSAADCSMGYEALLRRGFAGDFHALLAWWRSARNSAAH